MVQILDASGRPMVRKQPKASMLIGGSQLPWDAADRTNEHLADWQPPLWSADGGLNPYRDTIVARVRDLVRNDGWASGAITRVLDNAVGANFRPIAKPDYRALAAYSGNKGFDPDWAFEFAKALDGSYRNWALDMGRWCDAQRSLTIPQIMRLAFRHKLIDGDALAMLHWREDRIGLGAARYATTVQIIDPDRLSNPQMRWDQRDVRGGVEVDGDGVAIAYHIRRAHQGDWWAATDSLTWDRIERETAWGRPIIIHDFDHDGQAGQHRGGAGILAPVLHRLKMLFRYDVAELDAALLNALFSAYLESPFDQEFVEASLGESEHLNAYQSERNEFHKEHKTSIGGSRVTKLFPGEKLGQVTAARPTANFKDFEKAVLRNVASAGGLSAQQVTNDWSDVNYSSARGAMMEFWKTMTRRRDDFSAGFGQPIFAAFVEEAMEMDDLPLPSGAPSFLECRTAYSRATWIGPGRGWINPVDEIKGAILGMDSALMDYDQICAEQGLDPDDMITARQHTIKRFKDAGIPLPTWSGMNPQGVPASQTISDENPDNGTGVK